MIGMLILKGGAFLADDKDEVVAYHAMTCLLT